MKGSFANVSRETEAVQKEQMYLKLNKLVEVALFYVFILWLFELNLVP